MLTLLEYVLLAILMAVNVAISRWLGQQSYLWMPPQATAEAQRVDALFSFLVAVGAFIFLGLVSVMLYSVLFFRASPEDFSEGHPMRGSAKIEIAWLVVPMLLVLWVSAQNINIYEQLNILGLKQVVHLPLEEPANAATDAGANADTPKPAAEQIAVVAKQWVWSFRYPNNVTSHELHLPVDQSTRLDLQSEDVIHGFYIPEFRLKQDIVPNRDIDLVVIPNRIGKYHLKDSQFSGADFSLMVADVYVESREAYQQWLVAATHQPPANSAATQLSTKPLINSGWYAGVSSQPSVADRSPHKAGSS
jgi:cytochrome c oxidase subunit 2